MAINNWTVAPTENNVCDNMRPENLKQEAPGTRLSAFHFPMSKPILTADAQMLVRFSLRPTVFQIQISHLI